MQTVVFLMLMVVYVVLGCKLLHAIRPRVARIVLGILLGAGLFGIGAVAVAVTGTVISILSALGKALIVIVLLCALIGAFCN